MALAQARMEFSDRRRSLPKFGEWVYLRLSKKGTDGYHLQNQTKLSFDKVGPFRVISPKSPLTYEIELPEWLTGIHNVISVEHLEPHNPEPYERPVPEPGPSR